MLDILDFVGKYCNRQRFNKELIMGLRESDSFLEYLEDVCEALEAIQEIKFKKDKTEIITDESQFKRKSIPIYDTRMYKIRLFFDIEYKDEKEEKVLELYIPKLIDNCYYYINGIRYYPIYQIVDSTTYNTRTSIILKSLLMPINLKKEKREVKDLDDNYYYGYYHIINLFKHKVNILYYYLSEFGFDKTLKYFGYKKHIDIGEKDSIDKKENYTYFKFNKEYVIGFNSKMLTNKKSKSFVFCLLDILSKRINYDEINNIQYWKVKLGSFFTKNTNNQLEKSEKVLISFKRILDNRTKKNICNLEEKDRKDIFGVIRYMSKNFDSLLKKDNLSLFNKRLRYTEYQITPFTKKLSNNTYRILNSRNITFNKVKGIFRISPMTIIDDIKKSDLIRYDNSVNDMDLLNCKLKFSNRGPASLGEHSGKTVSVIYRSIHSSHVGNLALNTSSANDPGMSGILSPFAELKNKTHFKEKRKNEKKE